MTITTTETKATVLVIGNPEAPEIDVLQKLPAVNIVGVGQTPADFSHLTDEEWASIDVVMKMGGGKTPSKSHILHKSNDSSVSLTQSLEDFWPKLTGLKWLHSAAVGVEHLLTPALATSSVVVTNAKGVYSQSLAEFVLMACHWFSRGIPQFLEAKAARQWGLFQVEELRDKTMGIVGYGSIGRACAELARAYKMKVVALRRQQQHPSSQAEQQEELLDQLFPPSQLSELMAVSDYVVVCTPYTPETDQLVNAAAIAAMKQTGVLINVGRGKCVDEAALVEALQEQRIKGAALDVFETEPLPQSSPLWDLPNVFLSPHCSARTDRFMRDNMELFVENMKRYVAGQELLNVCDKTSGY